MLGKAIHGLSQKTRHFLWSFYWFPAKAIPLKAPPFQVWRNSVVSNVEQIHLWQHRRQCLPDLASCLCISVWQRHDVFISQPLIFAQTSASWSTMWLWWLQKVSAAPTGDSTIIHLVSAHTPCTCLEMLLPTFFLQEATSQGLVTVPFWVPHWHAQQPSAPEAVVSSSHCPKKDCFERSETFCKQLLHSLHQ